MKKVNSVSIKGDSLGVYDGMIYNASIKREPFEPTYRKEGVFRPQPKELIGR
jgi:hypothetical protein